MAVPAAQAKKMAMVVKVVAVAVWMVMVVMVVAMAVIDEACQAVARWRQRVRRRY